MKNNIVLIGMPGVGKSTVGVVLAKVLGYEFVDSDLLIQKAEGKLLKDIIVEKGAEGFIEVENQVNANINVTHSVIATGGSAVYGKEAMAHFKEIGTIVYLKQNLTELKARLSDINNRGVVLKNGQNLDTLFEERCELYEAYADLVVDEAGLSLEETLQKTLQLLEG